MTRRHSAGKQSTGRISVGELVEVAYAQAARHARQPQVVAVIASKFLEQMLATSDRPELVRQLQAGAV